MPESTVRDHLRVLSNGGLVVSEREPRTTRGRPRTLFVAAEHAGRSAHGREVTERALRLGQAYRAVVLQEEAGDDDGQLDVLDDHLDRLGFEPEPAGSLALRLQCPAMDLFRTLGPEVLCAVHLAVIEDVLTRSPGPLVVDRLVPAPPTDCRLSLERRRSHDSRHGDR